MRRTRDVIRDYKQGTDLGSIGLEIVLCVLVGFFGGRWLDGRFGTDPWLSILGFVFGLGAAAKAVLRATGQLKKIAEREEREKGNPSPSYEKDEPSRDTADRARRSEEEHP
jgi:F0F1-type ATP synthase assembly protein I